MFQTEHHPPSESTAIFKKGSIVGKLRTWDIARKVKVPESG